VTVRRLSSTIVTSDSVEELLGYQAEREAEANERIAPWQAAIKAGDCLRYTFEHAADLTVYAEVLRARKGSPYIFVRAYSVLVPTGEMGDVHRSIVGETITREAFEVARRRGWTELYHTGDAIAEL
jgi:hypothetical protein